MSWLHLGPKRPFLRQQVIDNFKARFREWPPKNASPVAAIEPWGKQFFVYNAPMDPDLYNDPRAPYLAAIRPTWVQDQDRVSMLQGEEKLQVLDGGPTDLQQSPVMQPPEVLPEVLRKRLAVKAQRAIGSETVLCATDFRQRPMIHMRPEEWLHFLQHLPELRQRLKQKQEEVIGLQERKSMMQMHNLHRKFFEEKYAQKKLGRERQWPKNEPVKAYKTGRMGPKARERMIRLTTTQLQTIASQMEE
mmetsp:Transcript_17754/g.41173  ORF Transcript_17754/g.41173 Transcript_17754/m.41173 type:complete len:247 (+) Transcript_17754:44-784(+)